MTAQGPTDSQIEFLIKGVAGNPIAMLNLARTLLVPTGQFTRARALCEEAIALAPADHEVVALARLVRSNFVRSWYFTMIQDVARPARYAQVFRELFKPGCTVLDIGTGTGLFAMIAAREGAGKVVSCESHPAVADAAREIIAKNGFSDQVTIISKDSRSLEVGTDLDAPADVLLWDNLANNLVGAEAFATLEDARRRLIKSDAPIIPARCELRVALMRSEAPADLQMGTIDGFDLTPFNQFRPTDFNIGRSQFAQCSDVATIFDFDFYRDETLKPRSDRVEVTATGGRVDGIVAWMRIHITEGITFEAVEAGTKAAGIHYHAVESFESAPGERITIAGTHDQLNTWFWVDPK